MTWPTYSAACRNSVNLLLQEGGSLSAYRANKAFGAEPKLGSWAQRLESQLAMRMGVKHAVAVNSGTAALHCALRSLDLSGGEVITSPYTFSATVASILLAGGVPVFADVDPDTFCITKETVKRVITRRTKAILPVDLFGGAAPIDSIQELGLPIIEDGCQAVGSNALGVRVSKAIGVSFNGGKNIPAGECGALLTNSYRIAEQARLLMNHAENFGADYVGYNYRPNELTACVAYHGLMELGENNRQRIQLAEALTSMIRASQRLSRFIEVPESVKFDGSHVFYVYPFKVKNLNRKRFASKMMLRHKILVGEGYIRPALHEYKAFRKYVTKPLPVVERLSGETLCLFYDVAPGASIKDMERKVDAMEDCVRYR
jgi:dTDP-4-amino-4,6-dideoxygalactose transaminase